MKRYDCDTEYNHGVMTQDPDGEYVRHKDIKQHALDFFYWWFNQPGTNTNQGYDKYIEHLKAKETTDEKITV